VSSVESTNPGVRRGLVLRIVATLTALALWFWSQSLIGARAPSPEIGDAVQNLFGGMNSYFGHHPSAANALLIVSSGFIDALGLFLVAEWIFVGRVRPFLGLVLLLGLRQIIQTLCTLPAPPHMIWRYPGFPSLFVTYNVGNDYFFSGHTAIAVFGAMELAGFRRKWLTALAVVIVFFEIAAVLILRAHYTMDVFAGAMVGLWVAAFSEAVSPRLERLLSQTG
jgi:PAP2 superfamily C-terminal